MPYLCRLHQGIYTGYNRVLIVRLYLYRLLHGILFLRLHRWVTPPLSLVSDSIAARGEKLELLVDKTEDLSNNVSCTKSQLLVSYCCCIHSFVRSFVQSFIRYSGFIYHLLISSPFTSNTT